MTPLDDRIRHMIFEVTGIVPADISLTDDLFLDLGMDSVAAMELIGMLDEAFELDVEIERTLGVRTVQHVLDLAREHLGHG